VSVTAGLVGVLCHQAEGSLELRHGGLGLADSSSVGLCGGIVGALRCRVPRAGFIPSITQSSPELGEFFLNVHIGVREIDRRLAHFGGFDLLLVGVPGRIERILIVCVASIQLISEGFERCLDSALRRSEVVGVRLCFVILHGSLEQLRVLGDTVDVVLKLEVLRCHFSEVPRDGQEVLLW